MLPELPPFNLASAQVYAETGHLSEWIHRYLTDSSHHNPNVPLSEGLKREMRWWVGPLELPLADIERVCGPEEGMEYRVDAAGWERYMTMLVASFTRLEDFPPLIIFHDDNGHMTIRDGNHRHAAFTRMGLQTCYVFIWFNSAGAYRASRFAALNPRIT